MVPLALVLFARDTGSGYGRAGLLTAAYSLGCCLGGPALSRVMDLRGQRPALVLGGVVSSLALAVLPWVPSGGALVVALVAGLATPPLEPALRTLWPSVLSPRQVPSAFALDAAAQELIFVLGPLAVLLAQLAGDGGGLVAAGVVGLLGTAVVRGVAGLRRLGPAGPRGPALAGSAALAPAVRPLLGRRARGAHGRRAGRGAGRLRRVDRGPRVGARGWWPPTRWVR